MIGFPSVKQYKSKLNDWGLAKNIKSKDMRPIVRKDMKRRAEDPSKKTNYRLRRRPVPPERIERYKKMRAITDKTELSDARKFRRLGVVFLPLATYSS